MRPSVQSRILRTISGPSLSPEMSTRSKRGLRGDGLGLAHGWTARLFLLLAFVVVCGRLTAEHLEGERAFDGGMHGDGDVVRRDRPRYRRRPLPLWDGHPASPSRLASTISRVRSAAARASVTMGTPSETTGIGRVFFERHGLASNRLDEKRERTSLYYESSARAPHRSQQIARSAYRHVHAEREAGMKGRHERQGPTSGKNEDFASMLAEFEGRQAAGPALRGAGRRHGARAGGQARAGVGGGRRSRAARSRA